MCLSRKLGALGHLLHGGHAVSRHSPDHEQSVVGDFADQGFSVEAMGIEPTNLLHATHFRTYQPVTPRPSSCE
jgi:hypothetical protein